MSKKDHLILITQRGSLAFRAVLLFYLLLFLPDLHAGIFSVCTIAFNLLYERYLLKETFDALLKYLKANQKESIQRLLFSFTHFQLIANIIPESSHQMLAAKNQTWLYCV